MAIGSNGQVRVDNSTFDFGITGYSSFQRIQATSGTLRGNVDFNDVSDLASLFEFQDSLANISEVVLANHGTLFGPATIKSSLSNEVDGQIEISSGERLRFAGATNHNRGELVNLGGILRFDNEVTNLADGFISGRGTFAADNWENNGVMAFSSGNADILGDVNQFGAGAIVTTGNGTTTFFDDVSHNGVEIRTSAGSTTVFLGGMTGVGSFTGAGTVIHEGDLRPGNSPGTLAYEGNVVMGQFSTTNFELAGILHGEFDRLEIGGDLFLDGLLNVSLIDGFELGYGMEFLVADIGGDLFGQFNGLGEGDRIDVFNGFDLYISYEAGDGNDLGLFTRSIPEPTSAAVMGFGCLAVVLRRQRRKS